MGAVLGDLAEHDGREELLLADEAGDRGDDAVELVGRRGGAGGDGLEALSGTAEGVAQQRAVQPLLAVEVVVQHRLVDAGAPGDSIDARSGEAARGEFDRGGGEDPVRGDARGPGHETNRLVNNIP